MIISSPYAPLFPAQKPVQLIQPSQMQQQPFGRFFLNTMIYAIPSVIGSVASAAVVAYGFARMRWWSRDALFFICVSTLMIPFQVTMIPLYIIFKNLGWLNSY